MAERTEDETLDIAPVKTSGGPLVPVGGRGGPERGEARGDALSRRFGVSHTEPPGEVAAPARERRPWGLFELEGETLYLGGERVGGGEWTILAAKVSPEGRWAAFTAIPVNRPDSEPRLYVVDGQERTVRRLLEAFPDWFVWLT